MWQERLALAANAEQAAYDLARSVFMALQVIGAGLGRTGTLSLKLALEHLGFGPCYHMVEVLAGVRRNVPLWTEAAAGNPDWEAIFAGYRATTDYPACSFWRELADYYPRAKVILTTRDPDAWFDSVSETIFSDPHRARFEKGPVGAFMEATVYRDFGDRIHDRAFMTEWFERRNREVMETVPAERLLVYSVKEGWDPLCAFLDVRVPTEPFPRVNSREEMGASTEERDFSSPEELEGFARSYADELREKAFGEETR
jgi:hypothetical protein